MNAHTATVTLLTGALRDFESEARKLASPAYEPMPCHGDRFWRRSDLRTALAEMPLPRQFHPVKGTRRIIIDRKTAKVEVWLDCDQRWRIGANCDQPIAAVEDLNHELHGAGLNWNHWQTREEAELALADWRAA